MISELPDIPDINLLYKCVFESMTEKEKEIITKFALKMLIVNHGYKEVIKSIKGVEK